MKVRDNVSSKLVSDREYCTGFMLNCESRRRPDGSRPHLQI